MAGTCNNSNSDTPTAHPINSTSSSLQHPSTPQLTSNPSLLKRNQRGSNFTSEEDTALAKAYISTSENPIVGAEQKGETFFTVITSEYNNEHKPRKRECLPLEFIGKRCALINKACFRFSACHVSAVRSKRTGVSEEDLIRLATALYNFVHVENAADGPGKPFRFRDAWEVLRYHSNFLCDLPADKQDDLPPLSSEDLQGICDSRESYVTLFPKKEMPLGRRKAKEQISKEVVQNKRLKLQEDAVYAQKYRNESLKRQYQIQLFLNSPPGCDESDTVDFF